MRAKTLQTFSYGNRNLPLLMQVHHTVLENLMKIQRAQIANIRPMASDRLLNRFCNNTLGNHGHMSRVRSLM